MGDWVRFDGLRRTAERAIAVDWDRPASRHEIGRVARRLLALALFMCAGVLAAPAAASAFVKSEETGWMEAHSTAERQAITTPHYHHPPQRPAQANTNAPSLRT